MRCLLLLLLPLLLFLLLLLRLFAPLLENSAWKQQACFSVQTLARTHGSLLLRSLVKYRARRIGKIKIKIIKKKNR